MIAIRGADSAIAVALKAILSNVGVVALPRSEYKAHLIDCDRFLFCQGILRPKRLSEQTWEEITETFMANAGEVMFQCDNIIERNDKARICIIGSESGFSGSFDTSYAAAKAALHRYVETKKLRTAEQQIVCLAPSIISDCGMTLRREDTENLQRRAEEHPKGRFITAAEVAEVVKFALFDSTTFLSNTVIRLHGGQSTSR